jgi:group I intron endonuclease
MECGIYGLQNKLKPEKWNIGQTARPFEVRWNDYRTFKCKRQPKIYNALLKYGYDGFNKVILEVCDPNNQKQLDEREDYWIKFYDSIEKGYNVLRGGGHRHSKESKEKISAIQKGKKRGPYSEQHCKNISIAKKGKPLTEEHRKKLSIAWKTRPPVSDETRRKLSVASRGFIMPEDAKEKIRQFNLGSKRSEESKAKMRKSRLLYLSRIKCSAKSPSFKVSKHESLA